ncbi:ABC transporter substrate-binding protein [Azospirillum canadense]|uniref:ABC transporter substrate-binding protein n=1 Tax=Azospirillum canadense TaxID=403962 RepID=UPI0022275F4A|nr:ABC transporter substrate-binding protein [Azospirillum canadense]MCW2242341.1 peptide/nickel transport system substrate-binding protein [Azospirillum canadense]
MLKKGMAAVAAALVFGTVFASGARAADDAQPVQGGTLNVGYLSDTKTLDPIVSQQWTERPILFLMFDSLVDLAPDFSLKPGLAESWTFENGEKRIVLHLRKGVSFHDGTPFDAAAVKWNFDVRLDPAANSSQRSQLASVVTSVDVVDEHTVAINLTQPYPPLLAQLADRAGLMVSPTAAKTWGKDLGSHPVGTGPFKFKDWVRGNHITLVRNEGFWQPGMPHLDGVTFNDIPSNVVGVQRIAIGELDYVGQISPLDTRLAAANPDTALVAATGGNWYSLQWRWDTAPYSNEKFRQAVAHALNRDRINAIVWAGKGQISDGVTPNGLWWTPTDLVHYSYDPAKARALLAESGIAPNTTLTLAAPSGDPLRRLAELIKEDLDAVGLKIQLAPVPQSEYYAKTVAGEIKFTPMRWTQRADPDGLIQYLFASNGAANSTGYKNADVDTWIQEARVTTDAELRKSLYNKIQRQISADLPYVPIGFSSEFSAIRKVAHGFTPMPDLIPRFRSMWKSAK